MWIDEYIYILDTKWGGYEKAIAAYILRSGDEYAIIDTGYGASTQELIDTMNKIDADIEKLKYIILTHTHLDHMGGAGHLLKKANKAKVVVTEPGIINLIRPLRMYYGAKMVFGDDFKIDFGSVSKIDPNNLLIVEDNQVIKLGELSLRILETPGHTRDHISIYEEKTKTLFTGDAVCNNYPGFDALIPPASPPLYPVKTVVKSIEKLKRLDLNRILIPHYGLVEKDIDQFLDNNIETIESWKEYIINKLMKGYSYTELTELITKKLLEESNISLSETPKYVKEVVLPVLVKVSVLGYMATYINRFPPESF